jgi:serine/threonine protein phosphatase PrpC
VRAIVAAGTDIGHVREGNEDSFLVRDPLFAVADGMGGHRGGEVASGLALETMERLFERGEGTLAEQLQEANRTVFERSVADRSVAGMGTTLTAGLLEGDRIRLAHVGDSRAYLFRDGELQLLTQDHTLVHRMVLDGELTEEEAEVHPHRSILTRSVGVDPAVDVDQEELAVAPGDRLLLCTDGLTGMIRNDQIARILAEEPEPQGAVERLIREANDAGGVDNITAVVIDLEEGDSATRSDPPSRTSAAAGRDPEPPNATETGGRRGLGEQPSDLAGWDSLPAVRRRGSSARASAPPWSKIAVWAGVALGIVVIGLVGLRIYVDGQWYVGVSDGRVAVFRGIPTAVVGFDLHQVVLETTIPATDAEALALYRDLDSGITADSREEADAIVDRIRRDVASTGGDAPP